MDRDAERMLKRKTGKGWQIVEMPGGGGLKTPRLGLGCSAKDEDDEEEGKKNLGTGNRSPVRIYSYLHSHIG